VTDQAEAVAKKRFMVLNLVRFSGVIFVFLGIAVVRQLIEWPQEVGFLFVAVGLFDLFVFPHVLARRWRSEKE